ncbi:MAG TPA: hypothetical protein VI451_04535, partial [Anaerolineales bacterium]|nr:hypothetical protein [Anaerolineales bacterium]
MSRDPGGLRVLIVGCGELGSRHLQSLSTLPQVSEIEVVDPRLEALDLGRMRVSEVSDHRPSTVYRWLSSLEKAKKGGELCVVATQADIRCRVVCEVAEALGYSSFLLEKLVAQSVLDYENLMSFSKKKALSIWVNCKGRAHPSHKRVKEHLNSAEPIVFTVLGGNHGLANNGIHAADLFAFYDGARRIESAGSRIDPILHRSKRGNGVFDLSGTLYGYSEKQSQLMISFAADHEGPGQYAVVSRHYRAVIDDMMKWFYESTLESGWSWRQVPYEANLMVSNMTRAFAGDILERGGCELPTLEDCFPA